MNQNERHLPIQVCPPTSRNALKTKQVGRVRVRWEDHFSCLVSWRLGREGREKARKDILLRALGSGQRAANQSLLRSALYFFSRQVVFWPRRILWGIKFFVDCMCVHTVQGGKPRCVHRGYRETPRSNVINVPGREGMRGICWFLMRGQGGGRDIIIVER